MEPKVDEYKEIIKFIKKEFTTKAPPLMWVDVGQIRYIGQEKYKDVTAYVMEIETIDKNKDGTEQSRSKQYVKFVYFKRARSLNDFINSQNTQRKT